MKRRWYEARLLWLTSKPFSGVRQSVRYEDGQMDVYTYSWVNSIWTETVTRVHEDEPDPVAMQTTRRSRIYSRIGNLVEQRTELMTAPDVWEQIDGTAYAYTVAGNESKRTTFNGLITTSEWAGTCCGKSSETAPDGTRTTYTYDASGRLIVRTVLDPNPIETHIGYDTLGRQTTTWTTNRVAQLGTVPLRTTYDALGRVVSRTDQLGNTTSYSYSANERTTTIANPNTSTQITVTDTAGRILALSGTAVAPRTYTYGVNADGSQWTKVYQGTDTTALAWSKTTENMLGRTVREEKPGFGDTLLATTYTYDDGGRVLSQTLVDATDPVNPVILSKNLSQYDLYGTQTFSALDVNQNGVVDVAGPDRVMAHTSDYIAKDNALWQEASQSVYPDFNSDQKEIVLQTYRKCTEFGNTVAISETADVHVGVWVLQKSIRSDIGESILTTTIPTSMQSEIQKKRFGFLVEYVSTTAVTNRYVYDGLNRRIAIINGRGNLSIIGYTGSGQVAYTEDAATNTTSYVYDSLGRSVETIDALGQSTYTAYDLRGNVVKQYGATYPVWYEYDVEGRMIAMATTRDTTLDPATVDTLAHPSLDATRWVYDGATGLLVQKLYGDGKGPSYTYTPDGKLATRTWARGVVTEYGYNEADELASIHYSDGTLPVMNTYNRFGNPVKIVSAGTTNAFEYSAKKFAKISDIQLGYEIQYGYDDFDRMGTLVITNLYDAAYAYSAFGRLTTASFEGLDFNYSYLPGSDLVGGIAYGSVEKTVSYETLRNLVTGISYHNTNGLLIAERKYAYNGIGNVLSRTRQRGTESVESDVFGHNVRSELIAASLGGTNTVSGDYGYTYDPIGNRVVSTNRSDVAAYASNELNQYTNIVSDAEFTPEFDDDGNQIKVLTSTGVWSVQYNAENRPVVWSNVTGVVVEMDYDHMGRRIHKKIYDENGIQSHLRFIYDGYLQIAEIETNLVTTTFWDATESIATRPLAIISGSTPYLFTHDLTKNTMEILSQDGELETSYDYDAFGTVASIGTNPNKFQFSSEYYDSEVGCVYYNWRHYNPSLGEFLQVDPNTEIGFNLVTRNTFQRDYDDHSYVLSANNAIGFSDFIGLYSFSPFDGICNADQKIKIAEGFAALLKQLQKTIDMLEEKSKENGKTNRENICDCLNKAKALDSSTENKDAGKKFIDALKKELEDFKKKAGTKSNQLWPIIKCRPNNYITGMNKKMCDGNTMAFSSGPGSAIEFCPEGIYNSDEYGGIKCQALHEMFHIFGEARGGSDNPNGEAMTVGFTKCIDDTCKGYEKK